MSDMISRDAAYAAVQALIKDATLIGQRTMISHALTAIRALPAVEVGVKSGEIERAVWDAMGWVLRHAKQLPGEVIPTYTDGGNSDAETECRRAAARMVNEAKLGFYAIQCLHRDKPQLVTLDQFMDAILRDARAAGDGK